MHEASFIETALREFRRLKQLAEKALDQLDDGRFFACISEDANCAAILVKHLAGNMKSRWTDFLTSDGEKPDRDRDIEFVLFDGDTRQHLMTAWEQGWQCLFDALSPLDEQDIHRVVRIRGEAFTVLQAVARQLTHYAYHTGQIVFLARHLAGTNWTTLSVPRGGTAAFNANPRPYLAEGEPPR